MVLAMLVAQVSTSTAPENILIFGERPRPVDWLDDRTSVAEGIDLQDRLPVSESLGDVLSEAVGTRVLRSGGEGSFEGLSLRGSQPNHSVVLIDDLPVAGTDRGAVDLSMLPLQAFERVDIFRSNAPAWLDQGQIGGVVRLVPRLSLQNRVRGEVAAGSFGGYRVQGEGTFRLEDAGVVVAAGARTRTNDYAFFDDGATRFNPDDDRITRRRNARNRQMHGLVQSEWAAGGHRVGLFALGVHRQQGEPGPGHRQANRAERRRTQLLGTLGYTYEHPDVRVQAVINGGWDRDAFDDRDGEIGQSREDTDDRFIGLGGRLALRWTILDGLDTTVVTSARYDRYDPDNAFASPGDQPSERVTAGATIEARGHGQWGDVSWEVRPSASLRHSDARLVRRNLGQLETRAASEEVPNLRLGVFVSPTRWLSVQTSIGSGKRLPSVLELFGNRSSLIANPDLRAERATTWDAGLIGRYRRPAWAVPLNVRLEARAFVSQVDDLIRYERAQPFTARAVNVDSGRLVGVEGAVRCGVTEHVGLNAHGAWLDARDDAGRALPFRPALSGRVELEAHTGMLMPAIVDDLRARFEVMHVGSSWTDPANLVQLPGRTVLGGTVAVVFWGHRGRLSLSVQDLSDVAGTDLLGFPLPGRRFDVAFAWTEAL